MKKSQRRLVHSAIGHRLGVKIAKNLPILNEFFKTKWTTDSQLMM